MCIWQYHLSVCTYKNLHIYIHHTSLSYWYRVSASFPPPNDVRVVDVRPGQITFNWTSVDAECDSLSYNIISYNCGRCPSTTSNTSITCTNVVALGQVFTILVQTVVCGNTGILSQPTTVILKGINYYQHSRCCHNILLFVMYSSKSSDYPQYPSIASSFDALVSTLTAKP